MWAFSLEIQPISFTAVMPLLAMPSKNTKKIKVARHIVTALMMKLRSFLCTSRPERIDLSDCVFNEESTLIVNPEQKDSQTPQRLMALPRTGASALGRKRTLRMIPRESQSGVRRRATFGQKRTYSAALMNFFVQHEPEEGSSSNSSSISLLHGPHS